MRKETDLEAVKRVAKTFVYLDIQINEQVFKKIRNKCVNLTSNQASLI